MEATALAKKFVNSTQRHVFLTGKAGTGKTTFLHQLREHTHKNFAVVAPTGIAALNAQGVTIHSQFLLPIGTFLPTQDPAPVSAGSTAFFTQHTLARKHPLNAVRKQVLRNIDLLVIDEVSMLRADVLDAIDYRLKAARGNFSESFGGVQLLMIGDLFQLSPIVKDAEWPHLRLHYSSMFFYHAKAFQQAPMVTVELTKIFRQQDDTFIRILNNFRNNTVEAADLSTLNQRYLSEAEANKQEAITLTTHNRIAREINEQALTQLPGKSYRYEARIRGDFPASMYPAAPEIVLKEGAQIMFIKNDTQEQAYFNGKLATVTELQSDSITVQFPDTEELFELREEEWKNKRYTINSDTKDQEEEVIGTFTQYPIRLAWAITVHKSQGLTFDKAIVDLGQAFAPGQVYVALSRLRSLDGLMLRSKLSAELVSNNSEAVAFSKAQAEADALEKQLQEAQRDYLVKLLHQSFSLEAISRQIAYFQKSKAAQTEFEDDHLNQFLAEFKSRVDAQQTIARKFYAQLNTLIQQPNETLLQRVGDASGYFKQKLRDLMFEVLQHMATVQQFAKTKTYLRGIDEIDQLVFQALEKAVQAPVLVEQLLSNNDLQPDAERTEALQKDRHEQIETLGASMPKTTASTKTGRKRKSGGSKPKKGATYDTTFELLDSGKSVSEVAQERNLAESTIWGHVATLVGEKRLTITQFMNKEAVAEISNAMEKGDEGLKPVHARLEGKYTYGEIRLVAAFYKSLEE